MPLARARNPATSHRLRVAAGVCFALLTVAAAVLLARRLTHTSWPLAHAHTALVAIAAIAYFASFVLRALAWQRLFPGERPGQARCLASVGAAAASGAVLPFRLDYLVKVGTLSRIGGVRIGLKAIGLSIVTLGLIDAVAMLPLSISASATSTSLLRGPLLIVVVFGIGCCAILVAGDRLLRIPLLRRSRRARALLGHLEQAGRRRDLRSQLLAASLLFGCWSARAVGGVALLSALGADFSPTAALCVLCLGAAVGVVPITSGGAVANAGATAGVLLLLGVGRSQAINFSLASGLLLLIAAAAAAGVGFLGVLAARRRAPSVA